MTANKCCKGIVRVNKRKEGRNAFALIKTNKSLMKSNVYKPKQHSNLFIFCSLNNNKKFKSNVYKPKPHPHLLFVIVRTLNNTCNLMFTNPNQTQILFVLFILCSPNIKRYVMLPKPFLFVYLFTVQTTNN